MYTLVSVSGYPLTSRARRFYSFSHGRAMRWTLAEQERSAEAAEVV